MKLMTATEVSRNFSAVLDAVEHGETVTITRGSVRVATLSPAPPSNGKAFKEFMEAWRGKLDDEWEADVLSARESAIDDFKDPWDEN
ncbi:type II toxin-antitoxin system Phd/YefM family antitoxin [Glycomyces tenuis]|uniref:type II toxin-antitoxin system Phd/YefM family antitoxin n=1 Tax=Glycomyces tenuis TaxID=58116 RepID=UPI00047BC743|nr:type II toxin-antitoxin system prevent-host-death family antitoxin [Glycomyces tenuis]